MLEIIDDYENGVLCNPGDAHALADTLADTLAELRSNGDLPHKLVENGYRTAQERFGTRSYVVGVAGILKSVAGQ
ncbi:glycosyltransferase involved in cell wall biosynthesis [Paraburkholderia youngii]